MADEAGADVIDKPDAGDKSGADAGAKDKGADKGADKKQASDAGDKQDKGSSQSDYDWRGKLAGEDAKFRKMLDRYTDEPSFGKAFLEREKIASDPRRLMIPGEDATDDDRVAYAKARKIPDDPKKYEIKAKPPEGYEVTETDKTRLEAITARLHKRGGLHADPEVVNAVHELYYAEQEEAQAIAQATAIRQRELTQAQIAKLWPGHEGKRNVAFAQAAAEYYFGKAWDDIKDMQFVDGSLLGDNFEVLQALAKVGRDHVEDPLFLEAGRNGADPSKTLLDRKTAIMRLRDTNPKAYAEAARDGGELDQINEAIARHEERVGAMHS